MESVAQIKQAVILAGGRGERLRPITDSTPKPMVPINGRPFLEHLIDLLKRNGIAEVVLLVGYLSDKIIEHFGDGQNFGLSIKYSIGSVDDLTGTRLKNASPLLADEFLLLYGDNYWPIDLNHLDTFFRSVPADATLVAYDNVHGDAEHGRQNNLKIADDGRVEYYGPFGDDPQFNGVDMGFFLLKKDILKLAPADNFPFEQTILPQLINKGRLYAYKTRQPYRAITTVSQLPIMADFLKDKKVIFLDRDGVINRSAPPHDYIKQWAEFEFLPGSLSAITSLTQSGYEIYVVTNQRGIARGLMSEADLNDIHQRMIAQIESVGGKIRAIYHCPHDESDNCDCRKPQSGMLWRAAREHNLDLTKAIMIGDNESDRLAGESAGCRAFLLSLGEGLDQLISHYQLV